jgi:voltage-gated sodium channel
MIKQLRYLRVEWEAFFLSKKMHFFILAITIFNMITMGMEFSPYFKSWETFFISVNHFILLVYSCELSARLLVTQKKFFKHGWNIFDTFVILISIIAIDGDPTFQGLRALLALRIFEFIPKMRQVVNGIFYSIHGIFHSIILGSIVFYVYLLIGMHIYGPIAPNLFGTLPLGFRTLFQLMVFDGWSELVSTLSEHHPYTIYYAVSFTFLVAFGVLNLFIGIFVNALGIAFEEESEHSNKILLSNIQELTDQINALSKLQKEK